MPKLRSLKAIARDCRESWSRIVKTVYPTCILCLEKPAVDAHHLYGKRTYPALKYSTLNGAGLCKRCHLVVHDCCLAAFPAALAALGEERMDRLHHLAKQAQGVRPRWNRVTLEGVLKALGEEEQELQRPLER